MKNEAMEKIHKFGKIGYTVSKIALIISAVLVAVMLLVILVFSLFPRGSLTRSSRTETVFGIGMNEVPEDVQSEFHEKREEILADPEVQKYFRMLNDGFGYEMTDIRLTGNALQLVGVSDTTFFDYQDLSLQGFTTVVWLALEMVVLYFIKKLCKMFSDCETPFRQDIIEIIQKLFISLIPLVVFSLFGESIFNSIEKGRIEFFLDLNISAILAILIVFLLTFVFKYGAMLQQESDETL